MRVAAVHPQVKHRLRARKRKVCVNPPPVGKKRSSGQALKAAYVPKRVRRVTPSQRVSRAFGEQQQSSLHDLVTATLIVQYNSRKK